MIELFIVVVTAVVAVTATVFSFVYDGFAKTLVNFVRDRLPGV